MRFARITNPEMFRVVTRAYLIAWRKDGFPIVIAKFWRASLGMSPTGVRRRYANNNGHWQNSV